MIAQGAEAKVYYRDGDPTVTKERTSIYSTTEKALDAIVLHNSFFQETAMNAFGFTRDSDNLFRVILTQPYVRCLRLATKDEIDQLVFEKGFETTGQGRALLLQYKAPVTIFWCLRIFYPFQFICISTNDYG